MRDTLIGVLVIGGLIWFAMSMKTLRSLAPDISGPVASTSNTLKSEPPFHPSSKTRGNLHERTSRQSSQNENSAKNKRFAVHASEIAKLTSIYAPEDASATSGVNGRVETVEDDGDTAAIDARKKRTKKPAIAGVSARAYVLSKRNALPNVTLTAPTSQGLRVYLGCLEVKQKGLEYTGERLCESLAMGTPNDRRPTFRPSFQ